MTKYFRETALILRHYNSSSELGNQESNSVLQSPWQSYLSTTRFQKKIELKMHSFKIQRKRHIETVLHMISSILQGKCNVQVNSFSRKTMLWTNVAERYFQMNVQFLRITVIYVTVLDLISRQLKLFNYHKTQIAISTFPEPYICLTRLLLCR